MRHTPELFKRTLLSLAFLALAGVCQSRAASDVHIVRLTMPKVQASLNAFTDFAELLKSNPPLLQAYKEIAKESGDDDNSMSTALHKLQEKDSRVAVPFAKAGVSPGEAASTLVSLMGAGMQDAALKGKSLPPDTDPVVLDNLKFYRQNKDALTTAMA